MRCSAYSRARNLRKPDRRARPPHRRRQEQCRGRAPRRARTKFRRFAGARLGDAAPSSGARAAGILALVAGSQSSCSLANQVRRESRSHRINDESRGQVVSISGRNFASMSASRQTIGKANSVSDTVVAVPVNRPAAAGSLSRRRLGTRNDAGCWSARQPRRGPATSARRKSGSADAAALPLESLSFRWVP